MNVLIACEESQRVCLAFRKKNHNAFSCDILEPSGGHPEYHILGDALEAIKPGTHATMDGASHLIEKWDLIIAFPPCTYLTVTGNRWFNVDRYGDKALKRIEDRKEAIKFFMKFANADCEKVVIENPVGVMSTEWRKPDQIINPYLFGDPFEKKTCLWLKGVKPLTPTNIVKPPERTFYDSGKSMPAWYAELFNLPKEERAKQRSKTFPGIANAMAEQWG